MLHVERGSSGRGLLRIDGQMAEVVGNVAFSQWDQRYQGAHGPNLGQPPNERVDHVMAAQMGYGKYQPR